MGRKSAAPGNPGRPRRKAPGEHPGIERGVPARKEPGKRGPAGFPIVGIGASAGGLAAFEAFFSSLPAEADPGMAFVLVQHLAPDHESILAELIRRYTRMNVYEVKDGMSVKRNCAYIIPPNRDMAFLNGTLQLLEPSAPRGQRLPIDFFFRSLAQDQHELAIGIVLSGTGSDGTLGVRAIKGEGGMVMAQTPDSTEYDGMPRSAIGTGLVDYALPPAGMPAQLIAYAAHAFGRHPRPATTPASGAGEGESATRRIFVILRAQTGHDFSQYKPSTIHRRIERRMAVQQVESVDAYARYLQQAPGEVDALFRDLLIGVTSFFRDHAAFQALEELVIPKLFDGRSEGEPVRIWSAGCSTGEEAYSIAILVRERIEALKRAHEVQIFATDIDGPAIASARAGLYPASIAADITAERLGRFFTAEPGGSAYRIHKSIRDMLIFSEQDVNRDPPFSRLDLISSRNLLIYLGTELQRRLIPLIHYALNPGGYLFLGTSENVGEFSDGFVTLDRASRLYQRRPEPLGAQRAAPGRLLPRRASRTTARWQAPDRTTTPARLSVRELTEQALLKQVAPAAALVDGRGDILYLHGRAGAWLEPAPGETGINNILTMARAGLRHDLTLALKEAAAGNAVVRRPGMSVRLDGAVASVNLTVLPVPNHASAAATDPDGTLRPSLYLVIFEEAPAPTAADSPKVAGRAAGRHGGPGADDARVLALQQELRAKEDHIQAANEELETSNEELKSSNEELQSVNEEMQSTNEELETSKEELQSLNEELATVNAELQTKVTDLSHANNDMNNLLAGTGIGTLFVDHQLRILRFTPATTPIINLILGDVGRPVGHLVSNLVGYDRLIADTRAVLDTLVPREVDVQTVEGRWYRMRIQPYRTLDNVIEGAVISFFDITETKQATESLRESESRFRQIAESLPQLVWTCQPDGTSDYVSPRWTEFTGVPEARLLGAGWLDRIHEDDREAASRSWRTAVETGDPLQIELRIRHHTGEHRRFEARASALRGTDGRITKWFGQCRELPGPPDPGDGIEKNTDPDREADDLRRKAEGIARLRATSAPRDSVTLSTEVMQQTLHELRTYQIELELQNEELRRTQAEADAARARYFDLYDLAPVGYCTVSEPGLILEANLTAGTMLGVARGAMVGQAITRFIFTENQDIYYLHRKRLFETGAPQVCDLRMVRADGSRFWAQLAATVVRDGSGAPVCRVVMSDIDELKAGEEALAVSEANLHSLIEGTEDIFVSRDREGRVVAYNEAFASLVRKMFGVHVGPGLRTGDCLAAERKDHWERILATVLAGDVHHEEYSWQIDGSERRFEMTLTPIRVGGKVIGNVEFTRDVTERRRTEEHLRQAQKMETVGRLAGGVAHDFNNMLQVILSNVEILRGRIEAGGLLEKHVLEVRRAAERSAELTRQLLAFARRQTVSPKVLNLNEAVARTQEMIKRLIGEDIQLAWLPGAGLGKVRIDPAQLDQVLANLAVNARDAIGGVGRLTVETGNVSFDAEYCAAHQETTPGEYVQLVVSDDGQGMDGETMSHLFEPFFTTKGLGKGTGLGLATIYGIVKQNKGFIYVSSVPGRGTTFKVYLPQAVGGDEATDLEPGEAPPGGTETVLVVEDEVAILELARESLMGLGYTVLAASSPEEAIRTAGGHAGRIALLVTDVVMPQMNGRQLYEQLRAGRAGLKCLYMSGYTADVIAHRGVLEEGVNFIAKPYSSAALARKVREVLDG